MGPKTIEGANQRFLFASNMFFCDITVGIQFFVNFRLGYFLDETGLGRKFLIALRLIYFFKEDA